MKTKDESVNIQGLQVEMQPVLKHAEEVWKEILGVEATITSGCEAVDSNFKLTHSVGSLHYYGYAVDLRTWADDIGTQVSSKVRSELVNLLFSRLRNVSQYYDVISEPDHIHVEYDVLRKMGHDGAL